MSEQWKGPDEAWLLSQLADLQDRLDHRTSDKITVPLEVITNVQTAMVAMLSAFRDVDRIRYLDDFAKRRNGRWRVICAGVVIGDDRHLRVAMDQAISHMESQP